VPVRSWDWAAKGESMTRRQVVADFRVTSFIWKKKISHTLLELNIVPERFTGRVIISFKEGGISFVEKTETLK